MPTKKSPRKVAVTWKRAERPVKPATAISPARKYTDRELKTAHDKQMELRRLDRQEKYEDRMASSKTRYFGKTKVSKRADPDRERLATADAVNKLLKSKSSSATKGTAVMNNKKSSKLSKVAKTTRKSATVSKRPTKAPRYDEPKLSRIEKEAALLRLERKAASARMKKSLETYPKNPRVWEAKDHVEDGKKGKGKRAGKGRRNQAGAAMDRKASAKEARILARQQKLEAKEQAKADRLAAREAKRFEREEKKRLQNVPALEFTRAMFRDVMQEFVNSANAKIGERRLARLSNQAERISTFPIKKIQNRIRNMKVKIALMEAVVTIGKAALDDGFNKFLAPKERKGRKGGRPGFGPRRAKASADEGPVAKAVKKGVKAQPAKSKTTRKPASKKPESKANGSIKTVIQTDQVKARSRRDRAAEIGAALAMASRKANPRRK